jgi:putative glutamine amidotransferase
MSFLALLEALEPQVGRRLARMVGPEAAQDLRQELLLRAWRSAPRELDEAGMRAWLNRVGANLAIDELRRRRVRDVGELGDDVAAPERDPAERLASREALAAGPREERALVWLRFEAGLTHDEIAGVLDITPEAARKRVSRARSAFVERFREARPAALAPVLVVMDAEDPLEPYLTWLTGRGARVEVLDRDLADRQLSIADGLVITGSLGDVHPAHYGEPLRFADASDAGRDGVDLRVTLAALERGLPILGICRGHQLLNVALGGTLWQDVHQDGTTRSPHRGGNHGVRTVPDSSIRAWLGSGASVSTEHHQALRRLGRGVRVTSTSPDGVVESIEVAGRPLAVGLQWHPEHQASEQAGTRVGQAFVEGRVRRRAAA